MERFKAILNQLLALETVDEIFSYIESEKTVLLAKLSSFVPKYSFIVDNFGGMLFDSFVSYLKTFETKDALIQQINFYMEQIHEIAISTVHIINGNDNELLQTLANNTYNKLNVVTPVIVGTVIQPVTPPDIPVISVQKPIPFVNPTQNNG